MPAFAEHVQTVDIKAEASVNGYAPQPLIESVYDALLLGIRDYVRKTGFRQVVLGLSGGIDSALTCCLGVAALGRENVLGVTMPAPYSSGGSVEDSRRLAENLGIRFKTIPIGEIYHAYVANLTPFFEGRAPDITEENIQARIRGNMLMALSNKFGYLVLTTGNKSELAVGYCTLYGDMSGGLAVIADVPKTMVYELSRYINRERELIPEASLDQAAFGRAAPEPDRPGHAAALRRPRRDPEALCGRGPVAERDRGRRVRARDGRLGVAHGRPQRVQALAGGAGAEGHVQGVRHGAQDAVGGAVSARRNEDQR